MKIQSPMLAWLSLCLLLSAPLGAQPVPYQSPRVEPSAPVAGSIVNFVLDWSDCHAPVAPYILVAGNVINIVQSPSLEPCGVPPPPVTLRYRIGPFAAGDYRVRYSVALGQLTVFGPVDVPFSVSGTAQAIPLLDWRGMGLLAFLLLAAGAAIWRRRGINLGN